MTKYVEPFDKKLRGDEFGNLAPYRNGRPHRGQDWHPAEKTPIKAITDGTVFINEWTDVLGWIVVHSAKDGYWVLYAHLAEQSPLKLQDKVVAGQTVIGKVGGGKTFFFEVLNRFLEHKGKPQFIWHEADDLELILRNEGKDALIKLAKRPESILINDLGMEKKTKEGSNGYIISNIEQEPFEIFMYYRHKMWIKDPQTKTHITSNLTSEEFRTRYGDRTMSRMFECIDFIVYKNDQTDYRK